MAKIRTHQFKHSDGPVAAHKHPNGGGWVANTATVAETAYVGPKAKVYGNAEVIGNAQISDNAQVRDNARVYGNASASGNAKIYGDAHVYGDAEVYDNVFINEKVYGNAKVLGNAHVFGDAKIYGNAEILDESIICAQVRIYDNTKISGKTTIRRASRYCGDTHIHNNKRTVGNGKYKKMREQSAKLNETNDCAVVAIALTCKQPYEKIHTLLAKQGRRKRQGTYDHMMSAAYKELGYELVPSKRFKSKTTVTLGREVKGTSGRYIVCTDRHVAAIVTGSLEDWTGGRRCHIKEIYKVQKIA